MSKTAAGIITVLARAYADPKSVLVSGVMGTSPHRRNFGRAAPTAIRGIRRQVAGSFARASS
jgi:hypothetical protein